MCSRLYEKVLARFINLMLLLALKFLLMTHLIICYLLVF